MNLRLITLTAVLSISMSLVAQDKNPYTTWAKDENPKSYENIKLMGATGLEFFLESNAPVAKDDGTVRLGVTDVSEPLLVEADDFGIDFVVANVISFFCERGDGSRSETDHADF